MQNRVALPPWMNLPALQDAAARCKACPLYRDTTQTVFGAGPMHAEMMLIGDAPGAQDDILGEPFHGAAGKMLDRCLQEAGLSRQRIYITNIVKHFPHITGLTGRRRAAKPLPENIAACRPWLSAELAVVRPKIIICLGVLTARTLIGKPVDLARQRGEIYTTPFCPRVMVTHHPSGLLHPHGNRVEKTADFIADLKKAALALQNIQPF